MGFSGLTAAYLLHHDYDLTLFEANDYVSGHTHTHELEAEGRRWSVDSGFIVYNEKTYPNFIKLLRKLEIVSQKSSMGFSVKAPYKQLEYSGSSLIPTFHPAAALRGRKGVLEDMRTDFRKAKEIIYG